MTSNGKGNVYIVGNDDEVTRMFYLEGYNIILKDIKQADIVVFIGGADIDPSLYGETVNTKAHVYVENDKDKRDLIAWNEAPADALKIGICRGGQFLHVMNGGKLYQDVRGHGSRHKIIDTVWKTDLPIVTSSHHQMMVPTETAEVFAYSEGVGHAYQGEFGDMAAPEFEPEALWHERTRSLCVQFHPEWVDKASAERKYFLKLLDMVKG